jgi:hypothetical protein
MTIEPDVQAEYDARFYELSRRHEIRMRQGVSKVFKDDEFRRAFRQRYIDPIFELGRKALERIAYKP